MNRCITGSGHLMAPKLRLFLVVIKSKQLEEEHVLSVPRLILTEYEITFLCENVFSSAPERLNR